MPYKGAAPALTDLMAGQVQVSCVAAPAVQSFARSGKVRSVGVTTRQRTALAQDVPAVAETISGYELVGWYGLLAPLGTPRTIVDKINSEIARTLRTPEVQERLVSVGAEAVGSSPAEYTKFLQQETARWGRVLKEAGIKAAP